MEDGCDAEKPFDVDGRRNACDDLVKCVHFCCRDTVGRCGCDRDLWRYESRRAGRDCAEDADEDVVFDAIVYAVAHVVEDGFLGCSIGAEVDENRDGDADGNWDGEVDEGRGGEVHLDTAGKLPSG